jgi:hypothetical protein
VESDFDSETPFPPEILELLRNKKIADASYCVYWEEVDFLDVVCGDSPCTTATSWYVSTTIMQVVSVLLKMHEKDFASGGDTFAGIQFWGGVQNFVSHNYKRILGEYYESYRLEHNAGEWLVSVSDIIQFMLEDGRGLILSEWSKWEERVMRALREQRPEVHIPLLDL